MVARKRRLAARYEAAFGALRGLRFLSEPPGTVSNYWLNSIVLDAPGEALRDDVLATLNDAGYMARPVWTLMHELPMYAGCPRMDLEVAESMAARIVSLPSSAKLGE
jgi:perosamine synthetase